LTHRSPLARFESRVAYVTADRVAAAQWRARLVRECAADGRNAIVGTEVLPYRAFAANLWEARRAAGDPMLLSPRQSRALWRQVVADSAEGDRLLGAAGPARWAEEAWRAAAAFGIDLDAEGRRRRGADFAVFLAWARAYRARLRDARWIDDALLDAALARSAGTAAPRLVLADFEPAPSQRAVLSRLEGEGTHIEQAAPSAERGRAAALRCADPREELDAAAEWAAHRLAADPSACVAIVVPDLDGRAGEVRRVLCEALGIAAGEEASGRLYIAGERSSADERPLLGAVLGALELLQPSAGIAELSRWLRSPFFHAHGARAAAARLERTLRDDPRSGIPFLEAYRRAGLRARLRAVLPDAAARLDAALDRLGDAHPRSPAAWAALWPRVLDALDGPDWQRAGPGASDEQRRFEEAVVELARLTPIVGTMTAADALAELEAGMSREQASALPLAGVHVLADLEHVAPGYAGVWVTGATDARLPRQVELRPFLPVEVQVAAGMPWSSPRDALARSRALLERVLDRVPEAVFSWPEHVGDEPAEPSPLIRALPPPESGHDRRGAPRASSPPADRPTRRRETLRDPAPPLAGDRLPGGTAALDAQATCPLRAFCEHRLGARPLEPFERGVSPQVRGRILHHALERFFGAFDSHAALDRAAVGTLHDAMRREAARAAAEALGRGHALLDALAEIEAERATDVLAALVARERERAPFRIESLELDASLEVLGKTLRLRIDRIDALESGGIAVIDYKTGAAPRAPDWLGPRLRDVQLPAYATAVPAERIAALVVAVLRVDRAAYSGLWDAPDAFPGRGRAGANGRLSDLVETWRAGIAALVREYAAGDARLFVDTAESAAGPYAPLTRVYELLEPLAADSEAAR